MSSEPIDATEAELALLDVLWEHGPATIRQITEAVYGRATTSQYATVQKLLERLETKGCVERDRSGFAHVFFASISRDKLIGSALEQVASRLCQGSLTPLLMHLVEAGRLTADERAELRRLIDEAAASARQPQQRTSRKRKGRPT